MHEKEIRKNGKLIVSVPYRGYSFFNEFQPDKIKIAVKFPSLTGVIRFLIGIVGGEWQIDIAEFPSLTGVIRFLILNTGIFDRYTPIYKFPSLTGVIRFLIVLYITFENSLLKFPSLTGVIRFLMKKNYSYNIYDAVSVPYRGYSFFNMY